MAKKGIFKKIIAGITATALVGAGAVGVGCIANDDFKDKVFTTLNISQEEPKKESSAASNETTKIKELQTQLEANLEELESTKAELETTKTELETTKATNQAEISELENQLIAKNQELESTRTQLTEKVSEYETLSIEKAELQEQLEIANANITTLQSELDTVNANLEDANADIETLTARKTELEAELQTEQNNVSKLNAQLETANLDIENKASEIILLNENVSTLTTDKENLQGELNLKQTEIDNLNSEITILNAKIKEYEDALNEYDPSREMYSNLLMSSGIYNFTMSNGDILLTSKDYDTPGLFMINSVDYSISKIAEGNIYAYEYGFELPSKKVLLAANYTAPGDMLLYDMTTKEIFSFEHGNTFCNFHTLSNGDVLISSNQSSQGLLYFSDVNNTLEKIKNGASNEQGALNLIELENSNYIFRQGQSGPIYKFTLQDKTTEKLSDFRFSSYEKFENGDIVFISQYATDYGFCFYKNLDDTFSNFATSYQYACNYFKVNNKLYFSSGRYDSYYYLVEFDLTNYTETEISNSIKDVSLITDLINDDCLIKCCNTSSTNEYYRLNTSTKELSMVYDSSGIKATLSNVIYKKSNGDCLMFSGSSIFSYEYASNTTITGISPGGYIGNSFVVINTSDEIAFFSTTNKNYEGLFMFTGGSNPVIKVHNLGYDWSIIHELANGDILICSKYDKSYSSILLFNSSDETITDISIEYINANYDTIESTTDTGVYLTSTTHSYKIFYDYATKSITKIS